MLSEEYHQQYHQSNKTRTINTEYSLTNSNTARSHAHHQTK
ncbi:hypothetical protein DsansV1_C26g0191421 [Dioscorea sansibarensis]